MMNSAIVGICCMAFLATIGLPAAYAQQGVGPEPHWSQGRDYNENPGMGFNRGKTWREIMEEVQHAPILEDAYTIVSRSIRYQLSDLDDPVSSRAIAKEQAKQSIVNEIIEAIAVKAKAAKNVSKKVYGMSEGISYELLPDRDMIRMLLPSVIWVEGEEETLEGNALMVRAGTRVALAQIVPLVLGISDSEGALSEIRQIRNSALDALNVIMQIQRSGDAGKDKTMQEEYSDAVDKLMTADYLEQGRYNAIFGKAKSAIDAYSKALQVAPGLAIAYRNRGGVHWHQKDYRNAMADFLNAHTSDAMSHTEARDFGACINDTEAALKLHDEYGPAYYQRAVCRIGLKQQAAGIADLKKAAQLGEKRAQSLLRSKNIVW